MSILNENWHTWCVRGGNSKSGIRCLKFRPQNPFFLANLGRKRQSCLAHMASRGCWILFWHYFSKFSTLNPFMGNFVLKKSKLSVLLENWHTKYLQDGDSYFGISFLNFQPLIHFWVNLGRKSQSCPFCLIFITTLI